MSLSLLPTCLAIGFVAGLSGAMALGLGDERGAQDVIATAPDRARSNGVVAAHDIDPGQLRPDGRILDAVIHLRIVDPRLQQAIGGHSGRVTVDLDCRNSWYRSRDLVVFPGDAEQGTGRPARLDGEWAASGSAGWLRNLAMQACRFDTPPPAAPILAMATVGAVSEAQGPPAAPVRTGGGGTYYAQFISSPSASGVRSVVQKLAPGLAAIIGDHALSIERAQVNGVTHYRGRVGSYRTMADAQQACRDLQARGLGCLVVQRAADRAPPAEPGARQKDSSTPARTLRPGRR
jgi:SPOR domain